LTPGENGAEFLADKLTRLSQRRRDLEKGIAEADESLLAVREQAVKAEQVRDALADIAEVYSCLKPF
jgi:prefoldin subunit 5